ncbi:MAG: sulfotransferase domain-containing protein, partial [Gammaproteobacteria bacterium]|nr:sulfotransferase domain-containing protein [Gammaproteobacteria bacterium]
PELVDAPKVSAHLRSVAETINDKSYIEVGWPCYSHIPCFIKQFGNKVRVVHLVRHPVTVAASLTTHDFYLPENRNGFNLYGTLTPETRGTIMQGYRSRWETMSRFEKCLFHWAEINLYGLWLRDQYKHTPFLMLKAENLFENPEKVYRDLIAFMGLPVPETMVVDSKRVDKFSKKTRDEIDPGLLKQHPVVIELMEKFSYHDTSLPEEVIRRYKKDNRLNTWLKKLVGR